jgi:hypothetical protein
MEDAVECLIRALDAWDRDDDREGDELQHGGDEHDGAEPDHEGEPSLGWGVDGETGNESGVDCELAAQPSSRTMKKKRCLYRHRDRGPNRDGMHVDVDSGLKLGPRRIRSLSETQEQILMSRIDHSEVRR